MGNMASCNGYHTLVISSLRRHHFPSDAIAVPCRAGTPIAANMRRRSDAIYVNCDVRNKRNIICDGNNDNNDNNDNNQHNM